MKANPKITEKNGKGKKKKKRGKNYRKEK